MSQIDHNDTENVPSTNDAKRRGDVRNFANGERVFARALANAGQNFENVGGFGRIVSLDYERNAVEIQLSRTPMDAETVTVSAHAVETVADEEYPTYVCKPGMERRQ